MTLKKVQLDDKYLLDEGRIFITGTQALVRLSMSQHLRDQQAGHNTAGFISGYRGSPLGGLDDQLGKARQYLSAHNVLFQPGINEDLAATTIWGAQQAHLSGEGKFDGVFGMWYGKGPGVDRTGDAFRHANLAGTAALGGVLVLMGDDHTCESSSTCHQSEFAMVDAMIPVLSPAGVQEILDFGLLGWGLSRYSGCWVGIKCVKDTVEATATIDVDINRVKIAHPDDFVMPEGGLNIRQPDTPHAQEARLHRFKLGAVRAFARVNELDKCVVDSSKARLGVITHGKSYLDVLQALQDLDLSEADAAALGLRLYKVGMVWPLEPDGAAQFCEGLDKVLVVEEKRSLLEQQLKEQLYGRPGAPRIVGKLDEHGQVLFQSEMALDSNQVAIALGERLLQLQEYAPLRARVEHLRAYAPSKGDADLLTRSYYFCSGCPHSSSTVIPAGSKAYAGIGCHWMAQSMDRSTQGYTHMGGEGMVWVGEAPFSKRTHMFQNIGDGTYFHSGFLGIRAAVAAGTNITFKILFNDAVAMTGGQKHDGTLNVPAIAHQVHAEGVKRIVVVTDEPLKYPSDIRWPEGLTVHHRDELDKVQRELREVTGTSILIYDQTCAAEKRRRRKRGTFPDPAKRVVINDLVCEGCGDCGVQSNCVSVQPLETEFGRKRTIDQSSCNKDSSCVKGFCPSFVTVLGGNPKKPGQVVHEQVPLLPEPARPSIDAKVYSILVAGMGGTGVVTIGAILGMAAHLEGRGCGLLDMAGLAQKGGSVWSHLRFGPDPQSIKTIRIAAGGADLVLGCDLIVAGNAKTLAATRHGSTYVLANTHETMPGAFTRNADMQYPTQGLRSNIIEAVGQDHAEFVDAGRIATALLGDSIASNMFMLGFAYQRGLIPLTAVSIEAAIELNGTARKMNTDAFRWGRQAALNPQAVEQRLVARSSSQLSGVSPALVHTLDEQVSTRQTYLSAYQNDAYAQRFVSLVQRVRTLERSLFGQQEELTRAVAKYYFKLLAIKDEYEVARQHTESGFLQRISEQFEGNYKLVFNLAPPLLSRRDRDTGLAQKSEFGAWIIPAFKVLAKLRFLRGSVFDPFGYTHERRQERALIERYESVIEEVLSTLAGQGGESHYQTAVKLASLPEQIRGYGHVKARAMEAAFAQEAVFLDILRGRVIALKKVA
ncbi:indolepyruvate ferredoxin oxidoreductase family protein [Pseudomonas putida]|uniref:indolepyruvate ferredoxin oxidoreductase family protein n=2 Tax=Pseudomonas TaxID=286 RepID=UPI0034D6043D